ncbi:A/G-specific adenine glycosylase [Sphingomonas sp. KR1UV-12]|uniref:Adenine DNA glycosylase n=1 Tax=Sphingomonas aurea TaxID=3063994 RepID=A0ABT9EK08_9SPHN|nr:A/G-specific adenine glycosylase [Sphingomonas sp. KR1UV-12]MDP1027297.1 A/G-specific adenine glycosylase [Sphingomonas sp. KR1UV-12]
MDAKRSSIGAELLAWYDAHGRVLPWRARPGETADPYRVWLSEVMLQQTTVAAVRPRFENWVARWPDVASLAAADEGEVMAAWAGLGYYARARNLVKAARAVVDDHRGAFPTTEAELRALPGLGAYTAAAVAAIAFGERAVVVDANVERVVARLFAIDAPLPGARGAIRAAADSITPTLRAGDFAQAMMDLGATICSPKRPRCLLCPLREECRGFAEGEPERLPVKAKKKARPARFGTVFWLEGDGPGMTGSVWLVRRPPKGLLGGMRALPTGSWSEEPPLLADAPAATDWRVLPVTVAHGFTHFDLTLSLAIGRGTPQGEGEWWPVADVESAGLPTLFAKAVRAILESDR